MHNWLPDTTLLRFIRLQSNHCFFIRLVSLTSIRLDGPARFAALTCSSLLKYIVYLRLANPLLFCLNGVFDALAWA
jgi:hypothetical protein